MDDSGYENSRWRTRSTRARTEASGTRWTLTRSPSATGSGCSTSPGVMITSRYLWVLRALDRLRGVHQVQAHTDDVAAALAELAAVHDEAPRLDGSLRERLDALADDGMVHRLEDASRAGSLARYRNRQSVYQFSELGYRAFTAVEDVLSARIRDANLSRLVFSDILDDLKALAAATRAHDKEQVYRRLSRLDTVLDDMSRRAAQFHLTLGEIIRSTDTSPDTFLRYKNALLTHMTDFMAELDRYLPRLAAAVAEAQAAARPATGPGRHAASRRRGRRAPVPRPRRTARRLASPLGRAARLVRRRRRDGRRVPGGRPAHRHPRRRLRRHRAAAPGHRGAARRGEPVIPAPPPGRVGVRRARRGCRLRADVGGVQPQVGPAPRRRARRRRADLQPGDLVGRARRRDLGHAVPPREGADAGRAAAGPLQRGGQGRASPPPGGASARPNARPPRDCCNQART